MKKILVKIGMRKQLRSINIEDLSKLYYIKKRSYPKPPKFIEEETDC
jgi:hypothetical protein